MRLLCVGDGPRDARTTPALVQGILGRNIDSATLNWVDIRVRGAGYDRKLLFAMRQALDDGHDGLVATLDRDKAPKGTRLAALREARADQRNNGVLLRTAIGEADPHAEAWLLDDAVAVREGLGLDGAAEVPNVRKEKNPKEALTTLHRASSRRDDPTLDILQAIAAVVVPARCVHAKETGFHAFSEEVVSELARLP